MNETILLNYATNKGAYYVAGGKTPAGLNYSYLIGDIDVKNHLNIIYAIDLPLSVELHLLCIPKNYSRLPDINLSSLTANLEQVTLEGDYSNYFLLYARPAEQSTSRYVLDPAAMAYQVDFCANYMWEIVNHGLYFISEQTLPDSSIIDAFIEELLPEVPHEISSMSEFKNQQVIKQVERLGSIQSKLGCPICAKNLIKSQTGEWLVYPDWHGYLITGSQLMKIRTTQNENLMIQLSSLLGRPPKIITPSASKSDHQTIDCPNCGTKMDPTTYQYTKITIDVCPNCIYRWIDNSELDIVAGRYRNEVNVS
jgi:TFIIB-like protein